MVVSLGVWQVQRPSSNQAVPEGCLLPPLGIVEHGTWTLRVVGTEESQMLPNTLQLCTGFGMAQLTIQRQRGNLWQCAEAQSSPGSVRFHISIQ